MTARENRLVIKRLCLGAPSAGFLIAGCGTKAQGRAHDIGSDRHDQDQPADQGDILAAPADAHPALTALQAFAKYEHGIGGTHLTKILSKITVRLGLLTQDSCPPTRVLWLLG